MGPRLTTMPLTASISSTLRKWRGSEGEPGRLRANPGPASAIRHGEACRLASAFRLQAKPAFDRHRVAGWQGMLATLPGEPPGDVPRCEPVRCPSIGS